MRWNHKTDYSGFVALPPTDLQKTPSIRPAKVPGLKPSDDVTRRFTVPVKMVNGFSQYRKNSLWKKVFRSRNGDESIEVYSAVFEKTTVILNDARKLAWKRPTIRFSFPPRWRLYFFLHWTSCLIFYSGIRWLSRIPRGDAGLLISDRPASLIIFTIPSYHPYLLMKFFADLSNKRDSFYVSQAFGGYLGFPEATRDRWFLIVEAPLIGRPFHVITHICWSTFMLTYQISVAVSPPYSSVSPETERSYHPCQ